MTLVSENGHFVVNEPVDTVTIHDPDGKKIWEGSFEKFGALMGGMRWEYRILYDGPRRRLVSEWVETDADS